MPIETLKELINEITPEDLVIGITGSGGIWLFLRQLVLKNNSISSATDAVQINNKVRDSLLLSLDRLSKVADENQELRIELVGVKLKNIILQNEISELKKHLNELQEKFDIIKMRAPE